MFLPMLAFITLPDPTTTFASTTDWSAGMFTNMLPILYIVAGLLIGGMILGKVIGAVIRGAKKATGGGGRRRRR